MYISKHFLLEGDFSSCAFVIFSHNQTLVLIAYSIKVQRVSKVKHIRNKLIPLNCMCHLSNPVAFVELLSDGIF